MTPGGWGWLILFFPLWGTILIGLGWRWLRAGQAGERGDGFEQQRVDAGLLVGGAAGAELGDRAAVPGLGGELADPGGRGGGHDAGRPGGPPPGGGGGRGMRAGGAGGHG